MGLGALFGETKPQRTPWRRGRFPTAAPASMNIYEYILRLHNTDHNMHVVSTNFAKTVVYKCKYAVTFWHHKQRISSNNDHHIRHCSILEFGRGASNQAVAPGITRPLHATAHTAQVSG